MFLFGRITSYNVCYTKLLRGTVFAEQPTVQEINRLLERVEASGCRFVRNGTRYTGAEACAHIQKKYNHFKDKIKSAEDFVRLCATRSEMTGHPYQIIRNNFV